MNVLRQIRPVAKVVLGAAPDGNYPDSEAVRGGREIRQGKPSLGSEVG
jgi:hypothetical protein